jgi:hypothetical protein
MAATSIKNQKEYHVATKKKTATKSKKTLKGSKKVGSSKLMIVHY